MKHTKSDAMSGQELLDMLVAMTPEELANPVHFTYNYGDHWRTQVAATINSVEVGPIAYSNYHQMFRVLDEDKVDEAERELRGAMDEDANLDGVPEYDNQPILQALLLG